MTRSASEGGFLITGALGMLGRAWVELCISEGLEYRATDRDELDVCDRGAVEAALKESGAATLVNCAAYTDVDGAESEYEEAARLNGAAVRTLAECCETAGVTLVHYSTDYVFDGSDNTPYQTNHPREPMNAYGRSKALGEEAIETSGVEFLCVRTSWLYAPWGTNFVRTIAKAARERDELRVVNDQRGRPTEARQLASNTLGLLRHGARDMHHLTDSGECSWYEFAREIVKQLGLSTAVTPCSSEEYKRAARRPTYSVLDIAESETILKPLPHWSISLERALAAMESD